MYDLKNNNIRIIITALEFKTQEYTSMASPPPLLTGTRMQLEQTYTVTFETKK